MATTIYTLLAILVKAQINQTPHSTPLIFVFCLVTLRAPLLCLVIKGVMREAEKAPSHITVRLEDQHIAPMIQEPAGTKRTERSV